VYTQTGNNGTFYINGAFDSTGLVATPFLNYTRDLNYFGYGHGGWKSNQDLDEIKFWNRVLSPAEIQADYSTNSLVSYL
jgi:hypothetical protein